MSQLFRPLSAPLRMSPGTPLIPPRNAGDSPDHRRGSQRPCLCLSALSLEQRLCVTRRNPFRLRGHAPRP